MKNTHSFEAASVEVPVSKKKIEDALESLKDSEVPEAEQIIGNDSLVSEKEMKDAVDALNETTPEDMVQPLEEFQPPQEQIPVKRRKISRSPDRKRSEESVSEIESRISSLREELMDSSSGMETVSDGGNGNAGVEQMRGYDGDPLPPKQPFYYHHFHNEKPHGDHETMFKKAFGTGIWKFLNIFNPNVWKKYWKMLKEHDDPSLMKTTYEKEFGGYYQPNVVRKDDIIEKDDSE